VKEPGCSPREETRHNAARALCPDEKRGSRQEADRGRDPPHPMLIRAIAATITNKSSGSGSAAESPGHKTDPARDESVAPPSSRSSAIPKRSIAWAAINSKHATATASIPCSPLPATTSARLLRALCRALFKALPSAQPVQKQPLSGSSQATIR
jgi:hypothetical protein